MAQAKKTQKAVAATPAAEVATAIEVNPTLTPEEAAEAPVTLAQMEAEELAKAPESTLPDADKKRLRNYSQTAIDVVDLERLNGLKSLVKDKMKLSISNQRIITAALDCLGDNVEAFLKKLADEVNEKNKAKDLKTLEELKKKLNIE